MTEHAPELPQGFLCTGLHAGIKNSKRDLGLLVSEHPAEFWAVLTANRSRAHCMDRAEILRSRGGPLRALAAISGNANALTGSKGREDDATVAAAVAEQLGVPPEQVLTAWTGVIGHRPPVDRIVRGIERGLSQLGSSTVSFAESIMTTDRVMKIASREIFFSGKRTRLVAIAKGAGMIAPELATTFCFIATDAAVSQPALKLALESAVETTFNQITVDGDMSTNDIIAVMANGAAGNEEIEADHPDLKDFAEEIRSILEEMAIAIARDGEGANRLFEVEVTGAHSIAQARALSLQVASSMLVKSAIFGADPYAWSRIIASLGAAASYVDAPYDTGKLRLILQGETVFQDGEPVDLGNALAALRHRMSERDVKVIADLGQGQGRGKAWGCDLSYDYVKINADYATITTTDDQGSVSVDERLSKLGPTIKKKLLIEALSYIDKFRGAHAVIKLGGAAMLDEKLEQHFADDVLLLRAVGLKPVVVHGGGPEISRTLERLGMTSDFVDGLRITDKASMRVVEMVLTGSVNQRLVAALNKDGGCNAVGLSGKDGGLIRAKKLASETDYGQVGEVDQIQPEILRMLDRDGYVPVVSPVGLGPDGESFNINADIVAAEIAGAIGAEKLIYLSDVPGLLEGEELVTEVRSDQLKLHLEKGTVTGGMVPKLRSALKALSRGTQSVHLIDGRVPHNLIAELFTDSGVGTLIRRS